ncbi:MAG: DUF4296 domain-containing protein [Bacteroides sp.]
MRRKLNKLVFGGMLIGCFLLSACKKEMPKNVIRPAELEDLLYDYHLAKAMSGELSYDERYKQALYMDYVFEKHQTTKEAFDSSLVWYTRNTEEFSTIYENVSKRLKSQQGTLNHLIALRDKKPEKSQSGDTVNVWYAKKLYRLTPALATNKLRFTVLSDTAFKERDAMLWKVRYTFCPSKEKEKKAVMTLTIRYQNDSLLTTTKEIHRSGIFSIRLKSDSAYQIKEVSGVIYYPSVTVDTKRQLLLDKISLMRYHEPMKDHLAFVADSLRNDSIKRVQKQKKDTAKKELEVAPQPEQTIRKNPRDMNRPRPHYN